MSVGDENCDRNAVKYGIPGDTERSHVARRARGKRVDPFRLDRLRRDWPFEVRF